MSVLVAKEAPDFVAPAVMPDGIINLSDIVVLASHIGH